MKVNGVVYITVGEYCGCSGSINDADVCLSLKY